MQSAARTIEAILSPGGTMCRPLGRVACPGSARVHLGRYRRVGRRSPICPIAAQVDSARFGQWHVCAGQTRFRTCERARFPNPCAEGGVALIAHAKAGLVSSGLAPAGEDTYFCAVSLRPLRPPWAGATNGQGGSLTAGRRKESELETSGCRVKRLPGNHDVQRK